jgi:beta-phosphoglucomutase
LLFPHLSAEEQRDWFIKKEENFRKRAQSALKPLNGLLPLLDFLKSNGVKLAAVTNAPRVNAEFMLGVLNVRSYFEETVIADGIRERMGGGAMDCFGTQVECAPKPSPFPYYLAMLKLGVQPKNCIVFEDS